VRQRQDLARLVHGPTGLAPVDRWFLHKRRLAPRLAPTGLAPVERGLGHKGRFSPLVQKPPLHRGEPGGGEEGDARASCAETFAPLGRAR